MVVVGNVGVDTNVYLNQPEVDLSHESHYTDNVDYVGQAGGYAAMGYARLGLRVGIIGHVGDDPAGRMVRRQLQRFGVDVSGLELDPAGTARSINLMLPDGRRHNFYDGKGHMTLAPDMDRCRAMLARAPAAHFNIPNWARRLLPLARQLGVTVACDLQDLHDLDDAYRQDFVAAADYLMLSCANLPEPEHTLGELLARRPEVVALAGRGARGCLLAAAGQVRAFDPVDLPAPVVDSNGAGDSLAVGFLYGRLSLGRPLEQAVRMGQIAARHACTLRADSTGLITAAELQRLL